MKARLKIRVTSKTEAIHLAVHYTGNHLKAIFFSITNFCVSSTRCYTFIVLRSQDIIIT